ncbi:MAG: N-acetyltransferase [Bacteroidales bacterium]|nr:N-acetyltransferase [Bacteroidales bacterium]
MEQVTIRRVSVADAEALLAIYAPYVTDTAITFEYDVPSLDEFVSRIEHISAKYPYLVAEQDGKIVGYAYATEFKGREAYKWSVETTVYVDRSCHGLGTGRMLYEALEQALKKQGMMSLNACIAYTATKNDHLTNDSMYFHEKMGYKLVAHFHKSGRKFDEWYDMIWMEKLIGD